MQCRACAFENMPGQTACGRCGAQLAAAGDASPADLHPPRAGRLRLIRPFRYTLNRWFDHGPIAPPPWMLRLFPPGPHLPSSARVAVLLSVVPALFIRETQKLSP